MKRTSPYIAVAALLFIPQLPSIALATSYTTYEISSYSGSVSGWGGIPDWQKTPLFSGHATIQDYPVLVGGYGDAFFTWRIESFSITFNDGFLYSGSGYITLGTLFDYQIEDSYQFGDYRADTGYGPVDIAPHDMINEPFYKLPDSFGLNRPETYNIDLPELFYNGIAFYSPSSAPVPEPSTLLMLGIGIAGIIGKQKFSKNQKNYLDINV